VGVTIPLTQTLSFVKIVLYRTCNLQLENKPENITQTSLYFTKFEAQNDIAKSGPSRKREQDIYD
jgi:hypothetical protein